ncbi:SGNH/GDSL hydrolase family protein [Kytococcus sedentarius]|uniref:SGNH/GDSL hydrolase family protein n=1 Tax=Kytococcus sedentarius TaxID=1276 RepID=UPI0035BC31FC
MNVLDAVRREAVRRAPVAGAAAAGLTAVAAGTLGYELWRASQLSDGTPGNAPDENGIYTPGGAHHRQEVEAPWEFVVMGDSVANGVGAQRPAQTIGARCARRIAALSGRPVYLETVAVNSVTSLGLGEQVDRALRKFPHPDLVLISIGGNDISRNADLGACLQVLRQTVLRLRAAGAEVVVATCPDFGMIASLGQPLRWLMQRRSRRYAARQTVAVVESGGRTVSLGSLTTQAFLDDPDGMFHTDRFHPSAKGYKRAAQVLVPSLLDALALPVPERDAQHATGAVVERGRPDSLEHAAAQAASHEGTEVRPDEDSTPGRLRAMVQRRRRDAGDDADAAAPPQRATAPSSHRDVSQVTRHP